jgi:comEA protein
MQQFETASAQTLTEAQSSPVVADTVLIAKAEQPETKPRSHKKALPAARMNLNTASASQLQRLPRIGPKMAERILTYRTEKGGFKRVSELQNVRGIGEKTLEKLAPYLFVEGEA